MYRLEMIDDSGRRRIYPFPAGVSLVTIGRRRDNDIVLDDPAVSRSHAQIEIERGEVFIEDLESANGVVVSGQFIHERTRIEPGFEIIMGSHRFFLALDTDRDDEIDRTRDVARHPDVAAQLRTNTEFELEWGIETKPKYDPDK